jgi:putative ABC transport system substrate-binding protein
LLGAAVRRRDCIILLSGAAVAWPFAAYAQDKMRLVGILTGIRNDSETKARLSAFLPELQQLGWVEGRNLRIELRAGEGDVPTTRKYAKELVALAPDLIFCIGNTAVPLLIETSRSIPVVFTIVIDPVGAGFVESLSRPGGNVTGFMMFEYSLSGKWVELLKQIAPNVTRVAVLREPTSTAGIGQFAVIEAVAPSLGIEATAINVSDPREMERGVEAFARTTNGGLIVTAAPSVIINRQLIIALAARYSLPTIYFERLFPTNGGLISYGSNFIDQNRQAARYVDRILRGEKPADLPVQAPTKYELVINLKTAKAMGLAIPQAVLARADEVIE